MTRLSDSYCIVGPGPFKGRQEGYRQTTQYALEDSARYYRTRAKAALRISADEAEAPNAKAAILEAALVVLLEDGVPLNVPAPPRLAGPVVHTCDFPGCGAPAGNGFGELWSCAEHRDQVEVTWLAAVAERERRAAEILNKEPSTSLAGVPGFLI
jgi:hypothetical protein